ncbi:metallophosphoesterase (TIGR03767 family) [Frondihabitans australicus]|uniref:Metallophosphoesterase (TIGR03767 family) n=1 Tax=Frondihabitans australicus TaxID=386892 RepID=A0A495IFQ6_9MICO|nr:metallophosphoesterase (TIGR03767 family) [Frondihabitans australicus]
MGSASSPADDESAPRDGGGQPDEAARPAPVPPVHPEGSTLERTLLRTDVGPNGFRYHDVAPGEPYVVHTYLGGEAGPDRAGTRRVLASFVHLTDVHIQDTQSPARVEYLDRALDVLPHTPFRAAYRTQEMLSTQVAEAAVLSIDALRVGPATGEPLAFAVSTGDATDNCQRNELRWAITLFDGGTVTPDSGRIGRFEGVADSSADHYDPHYWHPDGTPVDAIGGNDVYRAKKGFPVIPGLLDAAIRPFEATGLRMPWFTAHGNHDTLVAGNFPEWPYWRRQAVGASKLLGGPGVGARLTAIVRRVRRQPVRAWEARRRVSPDPERRLLSRRQIVAEHFDTTGLPVGHGFTAENRRAGTAYYVTDVPSAEGVRPVRMIVLDTVNPTGEADGSLDRKQFAWLKATLDADPSRLTMIVSHHTAATLKNRLQSPGRLLRNGFRGRVLGHEVVSALLERPQVVLWVTGHTHENVVTPHWRTAPDGSRDGGFWEVTTASQIDWPQQVRAIEIVDNRDGTLSIFGTVVDSAAATRWDGALDSPLALASLSRELAANDPQESPRTADPTVLVDVDGLRGSLGDRNVELIVPFPAGVEL